MDRSDQPANHTMSASKDISLLFSKEIEGRRVDINLELITESSGTSFLPDVDTLDDKHREQYLDGHFFFFRHSVKIFTRSQAEMEATAKILAEAYKEKVKSKRSSRPRKRRADEEQKNLFDPIQFEKPLPTTQSLVTLKEPKTLFQGLLFHIEGKQIVTFEDKCSEATFKCLAEEEFEKPLTCKNSSGRIDIDDKSSIVEDAKRLLSRGHVRHKVEQVFKELSIEVDCSELDFDLIMTSNEIPQARGSGIAKLPYNWEVLNKEMVPLD